MQYNFNKFINATIFFAQNVKHLGITKLNKLLYFSDFEHYRLYGRPILGDYYTRMKRGPVPSKSYSIFNANFRDKTDDSLKESIDVRIEISLFNILFKKIIAKKELDKSVFSKSEIEVMEKVAKEYPNSSANELSYKSHKEKPWLETPSLGIIDYKLALEQSESIPQEYAIYRETEDRLLEDALRS